MLQLASGELSREINVSATVMMQDYDFYVSTFAGTDVDFSASSGENVSCTVYMSDLDVILQAQTNIGATSEPYQMRIVSNQTVDNVAWSVAPESSVAVMVTVWVSSVPAWVMPLNKVNEPRAKASDTAVVTAP